MMNARISEASTKLPASPMAVYPFIPPTLPPHALTTQKDRSVDDARHLGEWLIGGAIAALAWVIKTFSGEHLTTMRELTGKVGKLSEDVAEIRGQLTQLSDRVDRIDK